VPPNGDAVAYLDSSALVKLVVAEPGSDELFGFLGQRPVRVSCSLARVEVVRAVHPQGPAAVARAGQVLRRIRLLRLDDELLDDATAINRRVPRSLDAIHLAAAQRLGDRLREVVTYACGCWTRRSCSVCLPSRPRLTVPAEVPLRARGSCPNDGLWGRGADLRGG
jgi:predicted nucleic acid-binding protein